MLAIVPNSIQGPNEELAIRAHELYQQLLRDLEAIDASFESVSRIIWQFMKEPKLVMAMGWEKAEDIFDEPEIRAKLVKMRLHSPAQVFRWKRLARLDERMPEFGVLRHDKLSMLAQSGKLTQLEAIADKVELGDTPLEQAVTAVQSIISEPPPEPPEGAPPFEIRGDVGYWRGKPAIRFTGKGVPSLHLRARLLYRPYHVKYYGDTSTLVVFDTDSGDSTKEGAMISLDPEFLEYVSSRLRIKIESQERL